MVGMFLMVSSVDDWCRTEYKYMYVWHEPYVCVDATYLNVRYSRESSLKALRLHIWKLRYINPDANMNEISEGIIVMLNNIVRRRGVYVTESDVYNEVSDIMNSEIPHNISQIVISKRRVEWKKNIIGLLEMSEDEMEEYVKYEGEYLSYKLRERVKDIKREYSIKCLNKTKMIMNLDKIQEGINNIGKEEVSISELGEYLCMSERVVRRALKYADKDILSKIAESSNEIVKNDCKLAIKEEVDRMKRDGEKISKYRVHKNTGLNRRTIEKYWNNI